MGGHVLPVGYAGYPYPYAVGYPHGLVAHANGAIVPADEPAVYAAKVAHAAAGGVVNPVGVYGLAYPVLLPTPTVLLSQLSPLMLLPPVLSILLLLHLLKNQLVCWLYLLVRKANRI